MNLEKTRIIHITTLIAVLIFSFFVGCASTKGSEQPSAVDGVLDLNEWNLEEDGNVKLSGQWEMYHGLLLYPEDFSGAVRPIITTYATLPAYWNATSVGGRKLPSKGYATYRLKILTDGKNEKLAVYVGFINVAYRLFVNGALVSSQGKVATSLKDEIPQNRPGVFDIGVPSKVNEVILQVSNFHHINGGPGETIYFGTESNIENHFGRKLFYDFFMMGCLLMMGCYQLVLFIHHRRYKAHLYFGIFCISTLVVIGSSFSQVYFFTLFFPDIPRDVLFTVLNVGLYLISPSLLSYFCSIFPSESLKPLEKGLWIISAVAALFTILAPSHISVYGMQAAKLVIIAVLVLCLLININAVLKKQKDALIILLGFILVFIGFIIDIMSSNNILFSFFTAISPYAVFVFVLILSYQLSMNLSRAFSTEEKLSNELSMKSGELYRKNIEMDKYIMEMQHAENMLCSTLTSLNQVINSLSSILVSVDREGIVNHWNAKAEKVTGIDSDNAVGKPVWNVLPLFGENREYFENLIASGTGTVREHVKLGKGESRYYNIAITQLDPNKPGDVVILVDDVTEIEKKEQQLRHMQRMDTVGTLAGGIAHDFNNTLMGIVSPLSLIRHVFRRDKTVDPVYLDKQLSIMEESSSRAVDMVKRLLTMSRRQELAYTPVDLNESVVHVINICKSSLDKNIMIKAGIHDEPAMVFADKTQLEQVLLNLCINASHAMTNMRGQGETTGGELRVEIERIYADFNFCKAHPEANVGDYWVTSVSDTGVGISEELLSKIFDPFFTTKKEGQGTGLGLAMVYGIVKEHKGFITVYSERGKGSVFNVFLPVYLGKGSLKTMEDKPGILFENELVLVADDDKMTLKSICEMLEMLGLKTITASDGREALDVYARHHETIAAVLLDLNMPVKHGRETFLEMKSIDPGVKVVISSGYAVDAAGIGALMDLGIEAFIPKPYSISRLKEVFSLVLHGF